MISMRRMIFTAIVGFAAFSSLHAGDGNRLNYLDENNPWYPHTNFPKLITPRWVGDEDVEAVVILAIDDMRDTKKYEDYLRPILIRLKQIDGRAPVSIMSCNVDPKDEQLQQWLAEGLSIEVHTVDHPCPLLQGGDFKKAKSTYDRCVDLMNQIPGNQPVAFRMPCCDSLNTVSPRFYAEIFNKTTANGHSLQASSSTFNIFTSADPDIPRELVQEADGSERFLKYIPKKFHFKGAVFNTFVNTIENYPYPYVINKLCWEFPCVVPSDWEAQHLHGKNNPKTVEDLKAALDITVHKQGVMNLVFHPHGWIRSDQVVELIDHAVKTHGKKVKFLTFREAVERLNKNLLGGRSLRNEAGGDNGVRLVDIDADGQLDVVDRSDSRLQSGRPLFTLPESLVSANVNANHAGLRFVDLNEDGHDDIVFSNHKRYGIWLFKDKKTGWSIEVMSGVRSTQASGGRQPADASNKDNANNAQNNQGADAPRSPLPLIVRKDGSDNGFFVHSRHLFWQNEDTANLPDLVDRRSFDELLKNIQPGPKSPQASLDSIRTRPGFRVELVAAEPLVMDPVAFEWGADGKLWVVEMADYPLGVDGQGTPGGRIRFLEDTTGDGKYDKSTLFLDGVRFPNGILPWKKGVLVTAAPDIFYAEDTDGDGKADKREVLFTGFIEGNQQHRANGLVYGLDNWVYLANGDSGGVIRSLKASGGHKPPVDSDASRVSNPSTGSRRPLADNGINIGAMDLRIKPDTGEIDLQAGRTQFGRNRDDWGNWFGSNNSNPLWHYVLADHYIRRNKHVAAPDARVHVSVAPGPSRCFPISRTLARFNNVNSANRFTSACSAIVYRDDLFGRQFVGNSFVSEPVHNLVHREVMQPRGYSFTSHRAADEQQSEFLASRDNWFRPTMIKTGPDGALWIADMYRHVIEHPQWIPKDWQQRLNLRAGDDRGRIYRVVPIQASNARQPAVASHVPRHFDRLSTAELVAALHSSNGWQRDTAQRLLIERNDPAAAPLLVAAAREDGAGETSRGGDTRSRALGRVHAFCTLDGLDTLSEDVLLAGLNDSHPGVRRHAVRLCERLDKHSPQLVAALETLTADDDPQVRLQLAYTLGEIDGTRAGVALGELLLAGGDNRFLRAAVMSSLNERNVERVAMTVFSSPNTDRSVKLIDDLMQMAAVFGRQATLVGLLQKVTAAVDGRYEPWQLSAVAGLLDVLSRQRTSLARLKADKSPQAQQALAQLAVLMQTARKTAADTKAEVTQRTAAVRLLGRGLKPADGDVALLASLLAPQQPAVIQQAAVKSLGRLDDARVPQALLSGWRTYGPDVRGDVLDALLTRTEWQTQLLDAVEQKRILARAFDAARRQRLLTHRTVAVRRRAARVFAADANSDRQQLITRYKSALVLEGHRLRGAELFKKHCSVCHKLAGVGVVVGPDLKSLTDKSPAAMLVAMLDPNRAVESKYISYTAVTIDGRTFNGLLAAESGNSITLKEAKGKQHVILRTDLEELVSSSKSTMPEGLEKELKPQDIADIIAHVRSNVPLPTRKQFEGNQPTLVQADADGSLLLTAATCEIYGRTIVLEKTYGNLGFWSSEDDHVVWDVAVRKAGRYNVEIEYACHNNAAGDRWLLRSADGSLEGIVAGTGTWETYQTSRVGRIQLSAGRQQISMRAAATIRRGAMLDLKSIRLKPAE